MFAPWAADALATAAPIPQGLLAPVTTITLSSSAVWIMALPTFGEDWRRIGKEEKSTEAAGHNYLGAVPFFSPCENARRPNTESERQ